VTPGGATRTIAIEAGHMKKVTLPGLKESHFKAKGVPTYTPLGMELSLFAVLYEEVVKLRQNNSAMLRTVALIKGYKLSALQFFLFWFTPMTFLIYEADL
jgi:hypothetical protein